jgi:hypothetical protein
LREKPRLYVSEKRVLRGMLRIKRIKEENID